MNDGYEFVPFPKEVHRGPRKTAVLDRRVADTFSGTIDVTFVTRQPVHVGSGFKSLCDDGTIVRRGVLIEGGPGVPGASLKGVLRSRYEAITKSCALKAPRQKDGIRSSSTDIKHAYLTPGALKEAVFEPCSVGNMCAACALFGRMSQRSRMTVTDFVAEGEFVGDEMRQQFSPNLHHLGKATPDTTDGKRQFAVSKLHGRKFAVGEGPTSQEAVMQHVETIAENSVLQGSLRLFNLGKEELGGLLAVLGKNPASCLKIGAGKGQRFGRIELKDLTWKLQDHARKPIEVNVARLDEWRKAFQDSADYWDVGEKKLVEMHQAGC